MQPFTQVLKKHRYLHSGIGIATSSLLLSASLSGVALADWPVAVQDKVNAGTSQSIVIQVLANDIGNDLVLNEVNTTTVGLGSAYINADKQSITYKSADGFTGEDSFWYNFKDSQGRANATQVFVKVTDVSKPPEWPSAANDSIDTTVNTPVKIPVLANDGGIGLRITQVNEGTVGWGKAEIVDGGQSILYTPASDYKGTDEFWYVFSDQWGRTNAGKVNPVVKSDYSAWPSAVADYAETVSTASVAVNVLENDSGENLKLTAVNDWTVKGGRARIEDSYIRYTPPSDFSGRDSFWYNFEDAQGRANSTQIFVDVTRGSTAPSVVEFCGANYETDGTAENTRVVSAADPASVKLSTSVATVDFPAQQEGNFAVVDSRRYFVVDTTDAKEIWMEKDGSTTKIATHPGSQDVYGAGIRNGVLYYSTSPESEFNQVRQESLYSHNGSALKLLGEYLVFTSYPIKLLAKTDGVYYYFIGVNNGQSRITYRVNPISGNAELLSTAGIGSYGGDFVTGIVMHEGMLYYSRSSSSRGFGNTYLIAKDIYADSDTVTSGPASTYGSLDHAVISNGRILFVTKSHTAGTYSAEQPLSPVYVTYPPKLFAVNSDNEYVELAVCEE